MSRPIWKSHLRPELLPPDHVVLLSENGYHLVSGAAYARLAHWLDGRWTAEEILDRVASEGVSPLGARLALSHLEALGLLCDADVVADPGWGTGERAYWHALGQDVTAVARRLAQASAAVRSVGGSGAAALERALGASGVTLAGDDGPRDRLIVVADDYLDPRLDEVNRAQLGQGGAWVLLKLVGTVLWVGPLFVPGRTGCWACLAHRLRLNRQTEQVVREQTGLARPLEPAAPWSVRLAAELAAVELVPWVATGRQEGLEGVLLTVDLKDNALVRHRLTARPQCPACGKGPLRSGTLSLRQDCPLRLDPSPKGALGDGRGQSPEAVLERFGHHVSPLTGVVRSLADLGEDGFPHVSASQAFPMHRYSFKVLRDNLLGRSGGKGFTLVEARVGALCEALERYSGMWQAEDEALPAARAEFGNAAVDLPTCLGFSPSQYAGRDAWNASNDEPHTWVPRPFDDDLTVDWVPLWSLTHERTCLLPAAYCYYGHPDVRHAFCSSDSNGCAAGGTLTEAVACGLLEVIERDAVAIWWYNRLRRPAIDLDRIDQPIVHELLERYRDRGRAVWALDLTTDVGIPVVTAISARVDHPVEDLIYGFGADFDPSVAVTKAVLELSQTHFWVAQRSADGTTHYRTDRPGARRWFRSATRADHPYLVPDPGPSLRERRATPWESQTDWRDDIVRCVDRLGDLGLEVLVLDQTRPDVGLPVCRVVVPGMCHFWRRFGSRRLYEVPVALGWRETPCSEDDLNPWCIYF